MSEGVPPEGESWEILTIAEAERRRDEVLEVLSDTESKISSYEQMERRSDEQNEVLNSLRREAEAHRLNVTILNNLIELLSRSDS